jgi:hypothetical protein
MEIALILNLPRKPLLCPARSHTERFIMAHYERGEDLVGEPLV